jgi:Fur family ferric uptake transcriptional regulator
MSGTQPARDRWIERCRSGGHRITAPRRAIGAVVYAATDHPDVVEIHRRALAIDPGISLATTYRTLNLFAERGLIEKHSFAGGRVRVERAASRHHDHLIDVTTGRVVEFRSEEIERLQAEVAARLGFELTGHRLELYARPLPSDERRRRPRRRDF